MATNTAPPFRVEFRHVEDVQNAAPAAKGSSRPAVARLPGNAKSAPRSRFSPVAAVPPAPHAESPLSQISPFAALAARLGRPLKVAILSDFTRIPYANGAVFQTRFLYQELRRCGHQVTVIGPHDPDASRDEIPEGTIELPAVPLKTYPGVYLPMPLASWMYDATRWDFDIVFGQTTSLLLELGVWLRKMKGIPFLCVNTTHLAAAYDVLLPERLSKIEAVHIGVDMALRRPIEALYASIYNESDGLVVLSEGLRDYWRERGVTAPIHVIPRAVQPENFDKPLGEDPYVEHFEALGLKDRGPRLVCAGRHTREKSQDRLIRIFAKYVLPVEPEATLTLIGQGPDMELYQRVARENGVADRVIFTGEVPFSKMPDYYAYADMFVHASLSETYGNVMGEALWCGTPTVAFADGMGVSSQIQDGVSGVLLSPGKGETAIEAADEAFGRAVVNLVRDPQLRARLGTNAAREARERATPRVVQQKIADAFQHAQDHAAAAGLRPMVGRPKALQWLTTFKHFRPWTTVTTSLYLAGYLRAAGSPKAAGTSKLKKLHGHIAGI